MGIRGKTLSVVMIIIVVTAGVLLGLAYLLAGTIASRSEHADVERALQRAAQGLENDAQPLNVFVGDWSGWDDTYNFVGGYDPDFQRTVLTPDVLDAYNVDFIVVTDAAGSIVGSVACDPATRRTSPLPAGLVDYLGTYPAMLRQSEVGSQMSGVIGLPEGVAIVAASPVTDTSGDAPVNGTILAGRFLDDRRLAAINGFTLVTTGAFSVLATDLPVDVAAARDRLAAGASSVLQSNGSTEVVGYALHRGIDGVPVAIVKVSQPRQAVMAARETVVQFSAAILAVLVLLVIAMAFALDRTVLRRLGELRTELERVRESGDTAARVDVAGQDEITAVANGVNEMLSEIEASQSNLAFLAVHDPLTMLFNRRTFETELQARLREERARGALLWFDLDHFKEINDSLGHAVGDQLLTQLAELLDAETRGSSLLARLGGDEFGVLLPDATRDEASAAAARLLEALSDHAFDVGGHSIRVSASVGIVLYPEHGRSADDLLSRADFAMYHAKDRGRNMAIVYTSDDEWRTEMTERIELAGEIVSAIREDRLVLYAQPSRRIADGACGSAELLLRMRGADGTLIEPSQFISTCERIGLIREVDRWVVRRAIELLAAEQRAGRKTCLSVNLSAMAFSDPELLGYVKSQIRANAMDPSCLTLEITETSAISDLTHAQHFMRELKAAGCRFALDDFGAGVSSFFYLRHLPVDDLKIDGSLVRNLAGAQADSHFLGAIVEMCRGLNITTVAEYIESEELLRIVAERGVEYAQGYYIGRPVPVEEYLGTAAG